jgi:hypothetical protein
MKYLSYDKLPHLKDIIKNALNNKSDIGHTHNKSEIMDHIDYELPAASVNSLGGVKIGENLSITEDGTLNAEKGFSGSYDDLTNQPIIPTVPTNISAFTNDAGYVTEEFVSNVVNEAISGALEGSY